MNDQSLASASRCPIDHQALARAAAPNGCPVSAGGAAFNPLEGDYMQAPAEYLRWAREQEPVSGARNWATGWSRATRT